MFGRIIEGLQMSLPRGKSGFRGLESSPLLHQLDQLVDSAAGHRGDMHIDSASANAGCNRLYGAADRACYRRG